MSSFASALGLIVGRSPVCYQKKGFTMQCYRFLPILVVMSVLCAGIREAGAVAFTWTNSLGGNWTTNGNWDNAERRFHGQLATNSASGIFRGNGIINLSGNASPFTPVAALISGELANDGTLSPGLSAGTLAVTGDVTNSSTSLLEIELGGTTAGTEHDQLTITGTFAIDGELLVTLIDGFENSITNSDTFTIVTFGDATGMFSNVVSRIDLPNKIDGLIPSLLVTIGPGSITLSDLQLRPVPEPSSIVLVGFAALGLSRLVHGRKRRRA